MKDKHIRLVLIAIFTLLAILYWLDEQGQKSVMRDVSVSLSPEWVQVDGINQRYIRCGELYECDSNMVQIYDQNAYFLLINPQIEFDGNHPGTGIIVETPGVPMSFTLATVTPQLICTAVACENGNLVGGDPGGCGAYCEPWTPVIPTPTCPGVADLAGNCMEEFEYTFTVPSPTPAQNYEFVEWDVDVKPYYRGLGQDGKPKDLNERGTYTLYNYSDGYRLPHCDFYPEPKDYNECSQVETHLLYIVHVISGQPVDRDSYWGAINGSTFICLYANGTWYTDWRP